MTRKRKLDHRRKRPSAATLFEGSTSNQTDAARPSAISSEHARDLKWQMTPANWRQMLSVGRFLYANLGPVHGAVNEIATYAVGDAWIPQYQGRNKRWGELAEGWLLNWFDICDVRGQPYDFRTDLFLTSVSISRDGDNALLLTETRDGYPMLQFLPAHRLGRVGFHRQILHEGPYRGLELCNGAVLNSVGRAVAFLVVEDEKDQTKDRYISARDMQLNLSPKWFDQGRGITALSHAIKDWSDYRDIRDFEKLGIKAASSVSLVEHNERGSADPGEEHFSDAADGSGVKVETLEGGAIRYFRANSGAGLSVVNSERPSGETQDFVRDQIMRGAYSGLEWPIEFSWNPEKLGGANIRMIVEKAERTVKKHQRYLAPVFFRAVRYGVAKAIKLGLLPFDEDWFMWDAQLPKSLTVDAGRESKAEIEEYRIGFRTLSEIYGKRGLDWQDAIRQRIAERKFLLEEAAAAGVNPDEIQMLTPNGNTPGSSGADQDEEED